MRNRGVVPLPDSRRSPATKVAGGYDRERHNERDDWFAQPYGESSVGLLEKRGDRLDCDRDKTPVIRAVSRIARILGFP